jgi:hypothetical protein
MKLKHYIQDLIDRKEIEVDSSAQSSPNANLKIYQNAFPKHTSGTGPGNPTQSSEQGKGKQAENADRKDYTNAYINYDNLIGCISQVQSSINVIHVKGVDTQCAITTRRGRITVAGVGPAPSVGTQYNILEHLGNTPAQISILDLLRTSPAYQEILNKALHDSHVPSDINLTEFQNLVGHLSTSCGVSFRPTDIPSNETDHNLPLCIAVMVKIFSIK